MASQQNQIENQEECVICMDIIESNGYKTECKHNFHVNCIYNWAIESEKCPCCRSKLNLKYIKFSKCSDKLIKKGKLSKFLESKDIISIRIYNNRNNLRFYLLEVHRVSKETIFFRKLKGATHNINKLIYEEGLFRIGISMIKDPKNHAHLYKLNKDKLDHNLFIKNPKINSDF